MKLSFLKQKKFVNFAVYILICIFPLFIANGYHNITNAKYYFFCIVSAASLAICLIISIVRQPLPSLKKNPFTSTDNFMFIFLIICVFSCLASNYRFAAFSGNNGRHMGLLAMFGMGAAFFFISQFYHLRFKEFCHFGISAVLICFMAVLQYIGYDPIFLLATVSVEKRPVFLSTIGNVNVFASYLCLSIPVAMCLSCFSEKIKHKIFWLIVSAFGFLALLTSNSDSVIIGFFVAVMVIFFITCKEKSSFVGFLDLCLVFFLSCGFFRFLRIIFARRTRILSFMTSVLIDPAIFIPLLAFFVILRVIFIKIQPDVRFYSVVRKAVLSFLIIGVIGAVGLIIWSTWIKPDFPLGIVERYFRLNDTWGSERGFFWKHLFKIFINMPLHKKFIGSGEDTIALLIREYYGSKLFDYMGYIYDNAHNEWLQYLLTLGIWGLVTYFAVIILTIRTCLKSHSILKYALLAGICAYFAQSFFNIIQPLTTPLFFVLIGLANTREDISYDIQNAA